MKKQILLFIPGVLFTLILVFMFIVAINYTSAQAPTKWTIFKSDTAGFQFKNNKVDTKLHVKSNGNSNLMLDSATNLYSSLFFYSNAKPQWSIFRGGSNYLQIGRYDDNGNAYQESPLAINRTNGVVSVDLFQLKPADPVALPNPATIGTIYFDSRYPAIRYFDGTEWKNVQSQSRPNWNATILGTQSGWACVQIPTVNCFDAGCQLKFKSTNLSDNQIWAYSGIIEANSNYAVFSAEADQSHVWRWRLNDGQYTGNWGHPSLSWLGDCRLQANGTCSSIVDELNLCGYQGWKLEAMLIPYQK